MDNLSPHFRPVNPEEEIGRTEDRLDALRSTRPENDSDIDQLGVQRDKILNAESEYIVSLQQRLDSLKATRPENDIDIKQIEDLLEAEKAKLNK